jgi:hypothetical protein
MPKTTFKVYGFNIAPLAQIKQARIGLILLSPGKEIKFTKTLILIT